MTLRRESRFPGVMPGLLLLAAAGISAAMSCSELPEPPLCIPCEKACPGELRCDTTLHQCVPKDAPHACNDVLASGLGGQGSAQASVNGAGGVPTAGIGGENSSDSLGGTGGMGNEAGATGPDPEPCVEACSATILTDHELDAVCTGAETAIQFEARCACDPPGTPREMTWALVSGPDELTLSEDGELRANVPDGDYHFDVQVFISNLYHASASFTLKVQNRCWVLFMTDDEAAAAVRVAAARVDTEGSPIVLPVSEEGAGSVTGFSISPDGRFVAQTLSSESAIRLELVELESHAARIKALDYEGNYAAHAFSNDSRWLALVTTGDDGADQQTLRLFNLTNGVSLTDSTSVAYESDLTWSGAGSVLYLGQATITPGDLLAAQEHTVQDSRLLERHEQPGTTLTRSETFYGFLVGASGYLARYDARMTYVDRRQPSWFEHPLASAISPTLEWSVHANTTNGMRVDPLAERYGLDPFTVAPRCEYVRAFSSDGSRFLCTEQEHFLVYQTQDSRGSLPFDELDVPGGFKSTVLRMTLSERGNWLAFVPNSEGLMLASAADFDADVFGTPALGEPDGYYEWDFLFSPDEQWLVVQHGRTLRVASLATGDRPEFLPMNDDVVLPEVPDCSPGWLTDPGHWCGAPRFRGNLLMSGAGRYIAFPDADGLVRVARLDTRRVIRAGPLAQSCLPPAHTTCLQFQ